MTCENCGRTTCSDPVTDSRPPDCDARCHRKYGFDYIDDCDRATLARWKAEAERLGELLSRTVGPVALEDLRRECAEAKASLATVTAERDEARAQVSDERTAAIVAQSERDALRAALAACEAERDEARAEIARVSDLVCTTTLGCGECLTCRTLAESNAKLAACEAALEELDVNVHRMVETRAAHSANLPKTAKPAEHADARAELHGAAAVGAVVRQVVRSLRAALSAPAKEPSE